MGKESATEITPIGLIHDAHEVLSSNKTHNLEKISGIPSMPPNLFLNLAVTLPSHQRPSEASHVCPVLIEGRYQMETYSLYSALLFTRAHKALVKSSALYRKEGCPLGGYHGHEQKTLILLTFP